MFRHRKQPPPYHHLEREKGEEAIFAPLTKPDSKRQYQRVKMKTICIKTKLKDDAINDVRSWFRNIQSRESEALETLENEGVFIESAFLDKQGDDYYLIYYMKATDIDYAYGVFSRSTLSIDTYYKSCWKKYCEGRVVLEEVLDLNRIDFKVCHK